MPQVTRDVPFDSTQEVVVQAEAIRKLIVSVLVRKGMFEVEATIAADRLVEADLRGIHSHGSRCLPK